MSGNFYPSLAYISAITKGTTTTVTFTEDHEFNDGEFISFRVSRPFGMVELNNKQGRILSHTDDTVTVNIESTNFNAFIDAGDDEQVPAIAVPAGSGIIPSQYVPTVTLLDSFDHIPP